jgi:hypothetical protein
MFQEVNNYYGNLTLNYLQPYSADGRFLSVYNQYCDGCLSGAIFSDISFGPLVLDTPRTTKAPIGSQQTDGSSNNNQDNTQVWLGIGLGVGICVLIFVNLLLIQFCINGATRYQTDPDVQKEKEFDPMQYIERSFDIRGSNADSVSVNDSEAFGISMEGSTTDSRVHSRHSSNASEYPLYPSESTRVRAMTEGSQSGTNAPSSMRPREGSLTSRPRGESLSRPRGTSISLAAAQTAGLPALPEKQEEDDLW